MAKSKTGTTDELLKTAEPIEGFKDLPRGEYEGHIKAGSAALVSKGNDQHSAKILLVVDDGGEQDGESQRYRQDLSSEFGMGLFLGVMKTLELGKPKDKKEMAKLLAETDDLRVRFFVGNKNEEYGANVYINELLEGGKHKADKDEEPEEPESNGDEDWTAESIADLSEKEMTKLAEDEGLDPDDFTWEELEAELVDILC